MSNLDLCCSILLDFNQGVDLDVMEICELFLTVNYINIDINSMSKYVQEQFEIFMESNRFVGIWRFDFMYVGIEGLYI